MTDERPLLVFRHTTAEAEKILNGLYERAGTSDFGPVEKDQTKGSTMRNDLIAMVVDFLAAESHSIHKGTFRSRVAALLSAQNRIHRWYTVQGC